MFSIGPGPDKVIWRRVGILWNFLLFSGVGWARGDCEELFEWFCGKDSSRCDLTLLCVRGCCLYEKQQPNASVKLEGMRRGQERGQYCDKAHGKQAWKQCVFLDGKGISFTTAGVMMMVWRGCRRRRCPTWGAVRFLRLAFGSGLTQATNML